MQGSECRDQSAGIRVQGSEWMEVKIADFAIMLTLVLHAITGVKG